MIKFSALGIGILLLAPAAQACPWASGTYVATISPDDSVKVTFNSKCSQAEITMSGGAPMTVDVVAGNKGWTATDGTFSLIFDTKGKRARATRGGAARNVRMKKI